MVDTDVMTEAVDAVMPVALDVHVVNATAVAVVLAVVDPKTNCVTTSDAVTRVVTVL